ncbi:carbohydrate kinase family protein [Lachnospiraceae bacterium OttesenSCG-928-E19]|nr:carbohydrate kinase family protein [Lachnospiraceae bacterium OttesenSCG-928-E19]
MYQKGIAIAGSLIADIGYTIDGYPEKGNLTRIYNPVSTTGGANNIAMDLAKLDKNLPLKVSGLVGEDEKGQFILDALSKYPNIDIQNVSRRGRTSLTYAMTEKIGKQRTFFYDPGNSEEYDIADIDFEHLDADFFLLEYLLVLGNLDKPDEEYGTRGARVLCEAKKRGMKTFIDMVSEESDRYEAIVRPALKYVDYYIANEVETSRVVGEKIYDKNGIVEERMWKALEEIKSLGVSEWAIIHSPSCGYGLNCKTGERVKVPSLKLPEGYVKGTTGAGDAFGAGVMYAAYRGLSLTEALESGAGCAACSLSAEDSISGVVSFEEMREVCERYGK